MDKKAKLTLDALMERARQSDRDTRKYKEFDSKELCGVVVLQRPVLSKVTAIIDRIESGDITTSEAIEANKELVYHCWPMVQDKKLQEAYDCTEPFDIVLKVLDDNIGELNKMAEMVLSMFGLAGEMQEAVKN